MLLTNGVQHIAGARNVGEINLGFDFVAFGAAGTSGLRTSLCFAGSGAEIRTHLLRLMLLQ